MSVAGELLGLLIVAAFTFVAWCPEPLGSRVMGYWSIMSSVDDLINETYDTSLDPDAALAQLQHALPIQGRVTCERTGDAELVAMTVNHTPAWAFIGVVPLFLFRCNRRTTVTAERTPTGARLTANGRLDVIAARQLASLPS